MACAPLCYRNGVGRAAVNRRYGKVGVSRNAALTTVENTIAKLGQ